ncbi:hypothetical protein [Ohtaekwangia koreensis]|uniref:Uncharacterized protein n=1 Tax=Ohtaekwangia koreensis TaxID=688867 RepID=A0A1T5MDI0_9BACT|nr:hypothetical protein [Ohtaekwangia koreensis]SKC85958.1 hypothetical protein SAMN05660236_5010 [Ohtaekwangia koreensis]
MRPRSNILKIEVVLLFLVLLQSCAFSQTDVQTVYITATGKRYHTSKCRYLKYSHVAIALPQANERGYTACSVCNPSRIKDPTPPVTSRQPEPALQQAQQAKKTVQVNEKKPILSTRCTARTKAGTRCKRNAKTNGKCWQHQ